MASKKNAGGRASVQSQGFSHSTNDDALINSQRGQIQQREIKAAVDEPPVINPYRRKTYQHPGKVRTGRPTTSPAEMLANSMVTENLSQAESTKTGDNNSRSNGADGKQRRRRGDRSKGETATPGSKAQRGSN